MNQLHGILTWVGMNIRNLVLKTGPETFETIAGTADLVVEPICALVGHPLIAFVEKGPDELRLVQLLPNHLHYQKQADDVKWLFKEQPAFERRADYQTEMTRIASRRNDLEQKWEAYSAAVSRPVP